MYGLGYYIIMKAIYKGGHGQIGKNEDGISKPIQIEEKPKGLGLGAVVDSLTLIKERGSLQDIFHKAGTI
jgi:hypothetical protein